MLFILLQPWLNTSVRNFYTTIDPSQNLCHDALTLVSTNYTTNRCASTRFSFFFPEPIVDINSAIDWEFDNVDFFSKRSVNHLSFSLNPGYQVLWRFYSQSYNDIMSLTCYSQASLTNKIALFSDVKFPLFSYNYSKVTISDPAFSSYNWKYIV